MHFTKTEDNFPVVFTVQTVYPPAYRNYNNLYMRLNKMRSMSTLSELPPCSMHHLFSQQRHLKSQNAQRKGVKKLKSKQVTAEQFCALCRGSRFLTWKIKG